MGQKKGIVECCAMWDKDTVKDGTGGCVIRMWLGGMKEQLQERGELMGQAIDGLGE